MAKRQTPIEQLALKQLNSGLQLTSYDYKIIEQAKEIEKEEIIKVFVDVSKANHIALGGTLTVKDILDYKEIAEIYYNETYKNTEP